MNPEMYWLFWEQTGRKTLLLQEQDPAGTKRSKKRISVLVVAAMDGAMENLLVINSALKRKAFSKIKNDLKRLPACIEWCAARKE